MTTTTIISDHNGNDSRWCSAQSHGDDECFYFKHNYWLIYVPVDKSNKVKGAEKQANKYRLVFPAWKNPESAWTLAGLPIARGQGPNGLTVQPTSSLWQSCQRESLPCNMAESPLRCVVIGGTQLWSVVNTCCFLPSVISYIRPNEETSDA